MLLGRPMTLVPQGRAVGSARPFFIMGLPLALVNYSNKAWPELPFVPASMHFMQRVILILFSCWGINLFGNSLGAESAVDVVGPPMIRSTVIGGASAMSERTWKIVPSRAAGGAADAPLRFPLCGALQPGDFLELRFGLRSLDASGSQAMMAIRLGDDHREGAMMSPAVASEEWVEQVRIWQVADDVDPADWRLDFYPYGAKVPFAVRDVHLLNHGADIDPAKLRTSVEGYYSGEESDAPWRKRAAEMITRNRQADMRVRVHDATGAEVLGLVVRVRQLRHAYAFGTAVVAARIVDQDIRPHVVRADFNWEAWKEDNCRYRAHLVELFNAAVPENDLKWPPWEGEPPRYRRDVTLAALHWMKDRRLQIRGHALIWPHPNHLPARVGADLADTARLDEHVRRHLADIGGATAGLIAEWDVFNEPVHSPIWQSLPPKLIADWTKAADQATGGARLFVNDFNIVADGAVRQRTIAKYHKIIQNLLNHEAPLGGIGFQGHFWSELVTPPERVWEVIDDFSRYGLPLRITEFDFTTRDDALQARYLRDFLTAWFAHPATDGFFLWGFWAPAHWRPEAALFRADWSARPAAGVWRELVWKEWWTDLSLRSGDAARVFHGRHQVEVITPNGNTVCHEVDVGPPGIVLDILLPSVHSEHPVEDPPQSP